jgi:hypothetical protein
LLANVATTASVAAEYFVALGVTTVATGAGDGVAIELEVSP